MQLDFTLSYTQDQWLCYNDEVKILVDSLDELDDKIESHLLQKFKSGNFEVKMYFDFDRFPQWHRQYMSHYFNRDLFFTLSE